MVIVSIILVAFLFLYIIGVVQLQKNEISELKIKIEENKELIKTFSNHHTRINKMREEQIICIREILRFIMREAGINIENIEDEELKNGDNFIKNKQFH